MGDAAGRPSADAETGCPECGDPRWSAADGCPACGHDGGRDASPARWALPPGAFAAVLVLGTVAVLTVGTVGKSGPLVNLLLVAGGAALAAAAVRMIRRPTDFQVVEAHGTDAFGMPRYGSARQTTEEQGTMAGVVLLIVGLGLAVAGVFAGAF